MKNRPTIEQYLERVATHVDSDYGRMVRGQFQDDAGSSELAMLIAPKGEELAQLQRAVAIMTPGEKAGAVDLSDEQIQKIAEDAQVDPANLAIFINGYILFCKRVP
ncbi:hypothetical protein ACFL6U_05910 [Planctomycetota bacterium]